MTSRMGHTTGGGRIRGMSGVGSGVGEPLGAGVGVGVGATLEAGVGVGLGPGEGLAVGAGIGVGVVAGVGVGAGAELPDVGVADPAPGVTVSAPARVAVAGSLAGGAPFGAAGEPDGVGPGLGSAVPRDGLAGMASPATAPPLAGGSTIVVVPAMVATDGDGPVSTMTATISAMTRPSPVPTAVCRSSATIDRISHLQWRSDGRSSAADRRPRAKRRPRRIRPPRRRTQPRAASRTTAATAPGS